MPFLSLSLLFLQVLRVSFDPDSRSVPISEPPLPDLRLPDRTTRGAFPLDVDVLPTRVSLALEPEEMRLIDFRDADGRRFAERGAFTCFEEEGVGELALAVEAGSGLPLLRAPSFSSKASMEAGLLDELRKDSIGVS